MRTGMIVLRAVFIGLAMIFGIFWLVWMFDINAYTKLQILWGPVDMTVIRRALGGAVVLCLCGFTATLHVMKRRFRMALIAAIIVVRAISECCVVGRFETGIFYLPKWKPGAGSFRGTPRKPVSGRIL